MLKLLLITGIKMCFGGVKFNSRCSYKQTLKQLLSATWFIQALNHIENRVEWQGKIPAFCRRTFECLMFYAQISTGSWHGFLAN
jgi:hypothetical protein